MEYIYLDDECNIAIRCESGNFYANYHNLNIKNGVVRLPDEHGGQQLSEDEIFWF